MRGTCRSQDKADYLKKLFSSYGDKFETCIVEDVQADNVFDDAVKGIDGILHTASPFYLANVKDPQELIGPAVHGTTSILRSAKKNGTKVQRVVITSSFASMLNGDQPVKEYDENDWNTYSPRIVEEKGKDAPGSDSYRASKVLAERAGWDFIKNEKPQFDFATVNPPLVFGKIKHQVPTPDKLNTSVAQFYALWKGKKAEETAENLSKPAGCFVDVQDVADAHILALTTEKAGSKRFPTSSGAFTWQDAIDALYETYPEEQLKKQGIPKGNPGGGKGVKMNTINAHLAEELLGIKFKSLKQTLKEMADGLDEYEKTVWKQ